MPKQKTRKSVAKRFKVTGTGKVLHHRARKSHLLTRMSSKSKRQLRKTNKLGPADRKRVKKMMNHGS
ncbi:MAG: 50S ribosomal protein L35 [bacterium]